MSSTKNGTTSVRPTVSSSVLAKPVTRRPETKGLPSAPWVWRRSQSREGELTPFLDQVTPAGESVARSGSWQTAVADINNDQRTDLVFLEGTPGSDPLVGVALGRSDGEFSDFTGGDYSYPELGDGPFEIRFGNLDGSGAPEVLLFPEGEPHNIFVLKNYEDLSGRFGLIARIRHENPDVLSDSQWGDYDLLTMDLNGDQKDDLVWVKDNGDVYTALAED